MEANLISLGPELTAELGDCEVGETKTMTIRVKVVSRDDKGITAEVGSVDPYDEENEEESEPTPTKSPALMKAMRGEDY